jgi:AraC-like DNA-binding protein
MTEKDPLSSALQTLRLTGAIFLDAELSAPWGFAAPAAGAQSPLLAPGTEHLVLFHFITEGQASARIRGREVLLLQAGDLLVVTQGDAHDLWNGRLVELTDSSSLLPRILRGEVVAERGGGGGSMTRFVCGYIGCERHAQDLFLAGLPRLFKVNIARGESGEWIQSSLRHLVTERETKRAGRGALSAKLAEALLIEALRCYVAELPKEQTGWLAAARDPAVGRAIAAIHAQPAQAWTLADLSKQAGMSRTVFADRFVRLMGQTPLGYLARWRMQLAARSLEITDDTVLQVALSVGYASEAAFARAFKREFALPPARYRNERRDGTGSRSKSAP